jgi:uncharacterized protein
MLGTFLNVAGILVGGTMGLARPQRLPLAIESWFKVSLAALTVFFGLRLTWISLTGPWLQLLKEFLILLLALGLGRLAGRLLQLQRFSNRLGEHARQRITTAKPGAPRRAAEGFKTCAVLFCAAPLGIVGALQDGLSLSRYFYPLAIKAAIDGLATLGLAPLFGWGVLVSSLPVLVFQGAITLVCAHWLEPFLSAHGLLNSVNAVGGLLVFCVALVMLGLKRIALTDYLPSLVIAPLLTWWWR